MKIFYLILGLIFVALLLKLVISFFIEKAKYNDVNKYANKDIEDDF